MSFSYKTLNSNDISLTSYIANKQWRVNNTTLSQNGVTIYIGENLPINFQNPFDPINDSETSNEEYRRLIFNSIKNLFYQNYTSGSLTGQFFNSSSFFNYEQSTLTSGSMLAAHRNLSTITGSSISTLLGASFDNAIYDDPSNLYDETSYTDIDYSLYDISKSLYDEMPFDPDKGGKIAVISIDQNIFGSGLIPNTIRISGSTYNIQDDGEGNLIDTLTTSSLYIGNAFYSHGLIVITDQDYICVFGAPPTAVNDYYSYLNVDYTSQSLDILSNDFADCGLIDPSNIIIYGNNFPSYTINNGIISITPDQSSVMPGNYQLSYSLFNYQGLGSNTASINLTITSLPLEINNLISSSVCFGSTASVPVTFSIDYGVPPYSYSLDNGTNYTGIPGFFDKTTSGSMTASLNNIVYVKDYLGTTVTQSFNSWYPPISYTTSIIKLPCSSTSSDGRITISDDGTGTSVSASIDGGSYFSLPKLFTLLSTGSHTIAVKNSFNCITSSISTLGVYPALTASVTQSNISCYSGSDGSITINLSNVIDDLAVYFRNPSGSYIISGTLLNEFDNNSITISNLSTGSYTCSIATIAGKTLQCQNYSNTFTLTQPASLPTFAASASYIDSCSNAIIFSARGGTSPYYYYATEDSTGTLFSSNSSSISLNSNNSGSYNLFVVDSKGCTTGVLAGLDIFERSFIYTGSFCELSASVKTGYVSSSGIQQVFTSGPYSGSLVTSSYSDGINLFGPKLIFTQSFVSGTNDFIYPCNYTNAPAYSRYYLNTIQCSPPSFCIAPTLLTANPVNCADQINWTSSYTVTYNSSSNSASYTVIQYSINNTFNSPSSSKIITNPSSGSLTVNTVTDLGIYTSPTNVIYFRAYNSCSNGSTSSYSNIITASCPEPQPTVFEPLSVTVINNSNNTIQVKTEDDDYTVENIISIPPYSNNTYTFNYDGADGITSLYPPNPFLSIGMIGFVALSQYEQSTSNFRSNNLLVSSNSPINGQVSTTTQGVFNYINPSLDDNRVFLGNYNENTNNFTFISDTEFDVYDLEVEIDRTVYEPGFNIVLTVDNN
jgi:hypothetical protein